MCIVDDDISMAKADCRGFIRVIQRRSTELTGGNSSACDAVHRSRDNGMIQRIMIICVVRLVRAPNALFAVSEVELTVEDALTSLCVASTCEERYTKRETTKAFERAQRCRHAQIYRAGWPFGEAKPRLLSPAIAAGICENRDRQIRLTVTVTLVHQIFYASHLILAEAAFPQTLLSSVQHRSRPRHTLVVNDFPVLLCNKYIVRTMLAIKM